MQLTPRYEGPSVLRVDIAIGDPSVPLLRQRRRLAAALAGLDEQQWSAASRCEGWSVQDVVAHLVGTNQFWAMSMSSALAGTPTRLLATFDPVATPAAMVESTRALSPSKVLSRYAETVDALADVVGGVVGDERSAVGESPPGHVELRAVALHALWDAWTHERDILVPLGLEQAEEDDEIQACLVYAASIGPALLACGGSTRAGVLAVDATRPSMSFVVEAADSSVVTARDPRPDDVIDARLDGDAVELIEGLTFRAPLEHDVAADGRWLLDGLAEVFDLT